MPIDFATCSYFWYLTVSSGFPTCSATEASNFKFRLKMESIYHSFYVSRYFGGKHRVEEDGFKMNGSYFSSHDNRLVSRQE